MFQMESYAAELKQLETLFSDVDRGLNPAGGAEMEAAMRDVEERLDELQDNAKLLSGNVQRHVHFKRLLLH